MKKTLYILLISILVSACQSRQFDDEGQVSNFNGDWEFVKDTGAVVKSSFFDKQSGINWEKVSLPHSANIEPFVITGKQWQGDCVYRKFFDVSNKLKGKHVALYFEGAMQVAEVYLNGELVQIHEGGYLPFYVDITEYINYGTENCIVVKLNNEDNTNVPPGKPLDDLDFNYFSGIYRNVHLLVKNKVHISNEIDADIVAGGGVFVSYSEVTKALAKVNVLVEILNETKLSQDIELEVMLSQEGTVVSNANISLVTVLANNSKSSNVSLEINQPKLWSPDSPHLYTLKVNVKSGNQLIDSRSEEIGIRTFSFSDKEGFTINGEKLKLRGTNRHQEYPYIGYALSDNANYRDAYKIKKAGFNFVRLSHYPQSKSFLKACDQLGILVMDAIPGWQFFGDSVFQDNAIKDVRQMVRRSRNHPCVILWEASLNESAMTKEFMIRAHNAVHQEYPGKDTYTCGWLDDVYDVFIPARQHAKAPDYWNNYSNDKPIFIAEYGDWEYYAQNAGFNQKAFSDLSEEERTSRQLRGYGQKRLTQQALNYQEAHNSNLQGSATGDANWLMFDYNRGYAPDIEASGIMDIFRLPKFAYYFYQSQQEIGESNVEGVSEPMVFIANYYNDPSFLDIKIYSNCDEVELFVNGISKGKRKADKDVNSTHLNHPPFTFELDTYSPGELEAIGYVNNKKVVSYVQRTPSEAYGLMLRMDESNKVLEHGCNDVVFLYAEVIDEKGTVVPDAAPLIRFNVEGNASLIGNPIHAEAGIATVLLKAGSVPGTIKIIAEADGLKKAELTIQVH
ncbi:DUF4982 domain-containing protein [Labilibacter sediminis]|nr:DUF4982 domain-containing protein [Labilibacter sediminis]